MLTRAAKAASGFVPRAGWAARLLALAAMAFAARAQLAWLWAWVAGMHNPSDFVGTLIVAWHFAVVVASAVAVALICDEMPRHLPDRSGVRLLRWVTGEAPLIMWGCLTSDGRVTPWRALVWILFWPAELLACLWVALWWLGAVVGAAMDLTICRKGPRGEKRR
jgi:hypothetical protein